MVQTVKQKDRQRELSHCFLQYTEPGLTLRHVQTGLSSVFSGARLIVLDSHARKHFLTFVYKNDAEGSELVQVV